MSINEFEKKVMNEKTLLMIGTTNGDIMILDMDNKKHN